MAVEFSDCRAVTHRMIADPPESSNRDLPHRKSAIAGKSLGLSPAKPTSLAVTIFGQHGDSREVNHGDSHVWRPRIRGRSKSRFS